MVLRLPDASGSMVALTCTSRWYASRRIKLEKEIKYHVVKNRHFKVLPEAPDTATRSMEVEQVLEHISSPFRWELLEIPDAKPKKLGPAQRKSGNE